jgi:hypothetical protein
VGGGEGVVALRIACRSDISLSASPGAFVETQLASQQAGHSFLLVGCWRQNTKYFDDVVDSRSCCSRDFIPTQKYGGADKSLARPGRKKATATEDFEFLISYL